MGADRPKRKTVLVVDDEFAVLELLSMALEGEGYRVFKAGDGVDALRVLVQRPCDLVICDEVMPAIGGAQLLDAMHAEPRLKLVPAILLVEASSRYAETGERAVRIVRKPVVLPDLIAVVEEALSPLEQSSDHTPVPVASPRDLKPGAR